MKKHVKKTGTMIAISGRSGCGNTTVSKMVADALGLKFINFTFRGLAEEHGIDLATVLERAKTDDFWDREVDSRQVQLARESGGCVLGSRLSIWLLEDADLKVYLKARSETRAKRIQKREGGDLQAIADFTHERDAQDHARYMDLYDIDNDKHDFVDLIIDTDNVSVEEITKMIVDKLHERQNGHN